MPIRHILPSIATPMEAPMPLSLSDARAIVLDPAAALAAPAVTAHAFALLAEARGGCIARPHLLRPAHLSDAPRRGGALPGLKKSGK